MTVNTLKSNGFKNLSAIRDKLNRMNLFKPDTNSVTKRELFAYVVTGMHNALNASCPEDLSWPEMSPDGSTIFFVDGDQFRQLTTRRWLTRKFIPYFKGKYGDELFCGFEEEMINFISDMFAVGKAFVDRVEKSMRFFTGDQITKAYSALDNIAHSCMTGSKADCTALYAANPESVSLVAHEYSRALLWHLPNGNKFLDRTYPTSSTRANELRRWAYEKGYEIRMSNLPGNHSEEAREPLSGTKWHMLLNRPKNNKIPYMDTFKLLHPCFTMDKKPKYVASIYGISGLNLTAYDCSDQYGHPEGLVFKCKMCKGMYLGHNVISNDVVTYKGNDGTLHKLYKPNRDQGICPNCSKRMFTCSVCGRQIHENNPYRHGRQIICERCRACNRFCTVCGRITQNGTLCERHGNAIMCSVCHEHMATTLASGVPLCYECKTQRFRELVINASRSWDYEFAQPQTSMDAARLMEDLLGSFVEQTEPTRTPADDNEVTF